MAKSAELVAFADWEDFERWACGERDQRRRACPICGWNAVTCLHTTSQMERAVKQTTDPMHGVAEVRVTDPKTGGQKGQKLERFDLIPVEPMVALARLYGQGAIKYDDDNWRRGYSWRLSIGAAGRHMAKWLMRQSYDTANGLKGGPIEIDANGKPIHTGEHHLICVVWHCFTLLMFELHGLGTDDRAATVEP